MVKLPSVQRMTAAHKASRFDSGNGQGTYSHQAHGGLLEHPVLDGATQSAEAERKVENPWRGLEDPSLIRHPKTGKKFPHRQ